MRASCLASPGCAHASPHGPRVHRRHTRLGLVHCCAARTTAPPAPPQEPRTACSSMLGRREQLMALGAGAVGLAVLPAAPAAAAAAASYDGSSPGLNAVEDENVPKFMKTASGIRIQELVSGSGAAPARGDRVLIDYVLRRSNGYFIYGTVEGVSFQPRDVPVGPVALQVPLGTEGPGQMIPGLAEMLLMMRQGGKLRAFIPPELGYKDCKKDEPQPPTFATKRQLCNHSREPLLLEVALLRVLPAGK